MREIKFRAWDKFRKEMIYLTDGKVIDNYYLFIYKDGYSIEFDNSEDEKKYYKEDRIELMQFTGLKDKNGKEIYEGDIIKGDISIGCIEWSKEDCCYQQRVKDYPSIMSRYVASHSEVIGNIYENPELLNKEKKNED